MKIAQRAATGLLVVVAATVGAAPAGAAQPLRAATVASHLVHAGGWSYFGDARAIARGPVVFSGCVSTTGEIIVHQYDRATGRSVHRRLHRNPEVDDHDNPALAVWHGRVWAFYSPHSGRVYPLDRRSAMHYRASRRGLDLRGGFGAEREVRTNSPGGLGFTYPNAVATPDKLWLFWRGGNWYPTFSYTRDGVRWVRARTLVLGPNGQRPYAKYVAAPDGTIHMVFSEAHPSSGRTSLFYVRYKAGRFSRANGRRVGTMGDLPLPTGRLDRIYRFNATVGRAWPHDIAVDADGRPVVVFTGRRHGAYGTDSFFYARWDGARWRRHRIVGAGPRSRTFTSGGITLDHQRPSWVVLSRRIGRWSQVELWRTGDGGASWEPPVRLTSARTHSFRPVIPRDDTDPATLTVLYVRGKPKSFRDFRTVVRIDELPTPEAVAVAARRAPAELRIDGHGFGHGVGLSQYGALGFARTEHRSFRWILAHYYRGTRVAPVAGARLRVRLKQLSALRVRASDLASAGGRRVSLTPARTYRLSAWQDGFRIVDLTTGRTRAHLHGSVRLSPGATPLQLLGRAENGVTDGRYRGALWIRRADADGVAVNDVALEDYLLGVVPGEMPATWPADALRAQSVAARSYALRSRRPAEPFDVYADTRSQVYGGIRAEASAATAAVQATRGLAVLAGATVAQTLFHASSGGRTAAVEEVFLTSPPVSYLVSVDDPFDRLSPHHDWRVTMSDAEAARRLGVPGELVDVAVLATTPTGRVRTVRVTGTLGFVDLDGPTVRARLGLRSTWFTLALRPAAVSAGAPPVRRSPAGRPGRRSAA